MGYFRFLVKVLARVRGPIERRKDGGGGENAVLAQAEAVLYHVSSLFLITGTAIILIALLI
jgi:hypothetical protein